MVRDSIPLAVLVIARRHLHEFDRRAVGIANINDAFSGVRSVRERLWFAGRLPTRRGNFLQHLTEIIDN